MSMYDELTLHFSDEPFDSVHKDADTTLQRLIANMVAKGSTEGTLAIKIDIELVQDMVENFDPSIPGDKRMVKIPKLSHKVSSMMQIKDETKGGKMYDGYELVWDEANGEYVMRPILTAQQTIWDAEYRDAPDAEGREEGESPATPVDGAAPLLPAHVGEVSPDAPSKVQEADDLFEYLRQFIGQDMQVFEALGNYTVRANRHTVVLSSAFSPNHRFFCSTEKLKPHVGHNIVCTCYGEKDSEGNIPNPANVSIECEDCNEVLFDVDAGEGNRNSSPDKDEPEETGGGEHKEEAESPAGNAEDAGPEDMSDAFGDYPYENPAQ